MVWPKYSWSSKVRNISVNEKNTTYVSIAKCVIVNKKKNIAVFLLFIKFIWGEERMEGVRIISEFKERLQELVSFTWMLLESKIVK